MKKTLPTTLVLLSLASIPIVAQDQTITVIDAAEISWDEDRPAAVDADGYVIRFAGQAVQRTVTLPPAPTDQANAQRIVARVNAEPIYTQAGDQRIANDPWTRLGRLCVLIPADDPQHEPTVIELMRFVTGFGGQADYEQDVTALAPLLYGRQTLQAQISSYSERPGWKISATLTYARQGVGYRRPVFAVPLFDDQHVTADDPNLRATVVVPRGLARPRLRIITTGHSTDGMAQNEFVSCTHVLRIDGTVVAQWRPWAERGGDLRSRNPWAGRSTTKGREMWSSDFDRSGWHPGLVVEPLMIPVPELGPGPHTIELQIKDIRPKKPDDEDHGYWVVSAVVVADEPWPSTGDGDDE